MPQHYIFREDKTGCLLDPLGGCGPFTLVLLQFLFQLGHILFPPRAKVALVDQVSLFRFPWGLRCFVCRYSLHVCLNDGDSSGYDEVLLKDILQDQGLRVCLDRLVSLHDANRGMGLVNGDRKEKGIEMGAGDCRRGKGGSGKRVETSNVG